MKEKHNSTITEDFLYFNSLKNVDTYFNRFKESIIIEVIQKVDKYVEMKDNYNNKTLEEKVDYMKSQKVSLVSEIILDKISMLIGTEVLEEFEKIEVKENEVDLDYLKEAFIIMSSIFVHYSKKIHTAFLVENYLHSILSEINESEKRYSVEDESKKEVFNDKIEKSFIEQDLEFLYLRTQLEKLNEKDVLRIKEIAKEYNVTHRITPEKVFEVVKEELAFELIEFFSELTPPSTKENLVFLLDAINSKIILKYTNDESKIKLSKIALKLINNFKI